MQGLWKMIIDMPLHKTGEKKPLNYRPLSLLHILAKTTEKIVTNQIIKYLEDNDKLSEPLSITFGVPR